MTESRPTDTALPHRQAPDPLPAESPHGDTAPSRIQEVIAKLEAATEGGGDIDGDIHEALGRVPLGYVRITKGSSGKWYKPSTPHEFYAPYYTTSIDAAITLVPPKFAWTCDECCRDKHAAVMADHDSLPDIHIEAEAATVALAICIVALKAHIAAPSREASPNILPE